MPGNRDYLDIPRRRIPPPYGEPPSPSDRHYRPARRASPRRGSPPPPLHSPPSTHHRHKSSRKKSKKKKRSRSKSTRSSEYDDDSPCEYEPKSRDEYERRSHSREKEIVNKLKILSDEHDSFSDADFDSPIFDSESKSTDQADQRLHDEEESRHSNDVTVSHSNDQEKQPCSNSQDATRHYSAYKLLHDPHLKPGAKLLYRFDGVVPNNMNFPAVQLRDPRVPLAKLWSRREPLDLPVPLFKVSRRSSETRSLVRELTLMDLIVQVDENYVGDPPPLEVTICNLNDNIDKVFLSDMVRIRLSIQKCGRFTF